MSGKDVNVWIAIGQSSIGNTDVCISPTVSVNVCGSVLRVEGVVGGVTGAKPLVEADVWAAASHYNWGFK